MLYLQHIHTDWARKQRVL